MDEMTLLRELRDDVVEPTAAELAPARAALLNRAGRRPARRRRLVVGAAVAVAASVAALVVVDPFSTSPATAAGLLHRAADRLGDQPTPGPDQYLAVETREDALGYVQDDTNRITGAYRFVTVSTTYVPADRSQVWVRRSWSLPPTVFYGGPEVRAAAERDDAVSAHADAPNVERARGGHFGNGELGGGAAGIDVTDLSDLPRDPQRLLDVLAASPGVDTSRSTKVISAASTLLRTGLVPRDLGRALFDALALLPDVRITARQASLDGRVGTAIGVSDGDSTSSVVIDPDTGAYLGQRQVQSGEEGAVPAGTVMDQTSLRTRVVTTLP